MASLLTTIGEEFTVRNSLEGATIEVALYNDSVDSATESFDLADLTTEPTGSNYARQSISAEAIQNADGNWQFQNPNKISYDTSDSTETVDGYILIANFTSNTAGDGSATDHIIAVGNLTQSRNLSDIDNFEIDAGGVGVEYD